MHLGIGDPINDSQNLTRLHVEVAVNLRGVVLERIFQCLPIHGNILKLLHAVGHLIFLFRTVWKLGSAGVEVPLTLAREGDVIRITVKSADRQDFLKKPNLH